MAGKPRTRVMVAALEQRTRERFDDVAATPLDYVADWVSAGRTMRQLCTELEVSAPMLSDYLRNTFGAATRDEKLRAARENAAHLLAEQSVEIADAAEPDSANVARLQVQTRQWLAERWNRRELGNDRAAVQLNVSIGSLMLDALRQPVTLAPTAIVEAIAVPAEVLSIEAASTCEYAQGIPNPSGDVQAQLTGST